MDPAVNTRATVNLEAGYYYMEIYHVNYGGRGYLKTSVEVPSNNSQLKWQTSEISSFTSGSIVTPETWSYTMPGAVGGSYKLKIIRTDRNTL